MSSMSKQNMKKAEAAVRAIAAKNGITEDEVRKEMTIAIESGYNNPDPAVQAYLNRRMKQKADDEYDVIEA